MTTDPQSLVFPPRDQASALREQVKAASVGLAICCCTSAEREPVARGHVLFCSSCGGYWDLEAKSLAVFVEGRRRLVDFAPRGADAIADELAEHESKGR